MLRWIWTLLFICFGLVSMACSQQGASAKRKEQPAKEPVAKVGGQSIQDEPAKARDPVAKVAGQSIYEEDLVPIIRSQMFQVRKQEYQIKSAAVENVIQQKLLEGEAKARGLTVAALLEREVNSKVHTTSDAEVDAFYLAQKDRVNKPLNEVKAQILQVLQQNKVQQVRERFVRGLRDKTQVTVYLSEPKQVVDFDPARVRGNAEAPITIVEFSDFQCPFCEQAYSVVKGLLAKYDGRVKLAYRDFPLRQIHPQAQGAAEAARCAGEQGKFWEYHDRLFENQRKLDQASLMEHAAAVELDPKQFKGCLDSGRFQAKIEQDLQEGTWAGVTGTPAFFINGTLVSGAQPAAEFEKVITAQLATSQQKKTQ